MPSRNWNWLDNGGVPLLVLALRLCWLWPWLEISRLWLLREISQPFLPLWGLAALLVGGYAAAQLAIAFAASLVRARIVVTCVGLGSILALLWWQYARTAYPFWDMQWPVMLAQEMATWHTGVPLPVVGLVVGAGAWIASMRDGVRPPRHEDVSRTFVRGIVALALLVLAASLNPVGLPPYTGVWILAYFGGGMVALALSGLELAGIGRRAQGGNRVGLRRNWVLSVLAIVLVLLGAALLLSLVFTPAVIGQILGLIVDLIGWIYLLFGYILIGIGTALAWLITPLFEWLQQRLESPMEDTEPEQAQGMMEQMEDIQGGEGVQIPPQAAVILQWSGLGVLVLALAFAIAWALRFMRREVEETDVIETRESVFSSDLLRTQVSSLWRQWMASRPGAGSAAIAPYLSLDAEEDGRRAVRAVYQTLLAEMSRMGLERSPAQTPDEYGSSLAAALPGQEHWLTTLTEAYRNIRYSDRVPSADEVARARHAWSALAEAVQDSEDQATRP